MVKQNASWNQPRLSESAVSSIKQGIPDWETLFGTFDLCRCEHCGSVLSPASYLVDILRWLDERNSLIPGKSAKDILFIQRPDLGEVELTCENTNTPLPYVDLVNELLENAISPATFDIIPINQSSINQLDNETLPPDFIIKFPQLGFAVPDNPVVSVITTGKKWTIAGQGLRYVLDKKPSSISISFFPQTSWTPQELTANPEHINIKAYEALLSTVYPWQLPFDLWTVEARIYLEHLGIPRFKLLQTLPNPVLGADTQQRNVTIAAEYLGLYKKELEIITGTAPEKSWEFWGYKSEFISGVKWVKDLSSVKRFLEQSGLSYKELDELSKLEFINSNGQIKVEPSGPAREPTCDISKLNINGLTGEDVVNRIHRLVRLWRRVGWTMRELDRVIITLNQPNTAIEDLIIQIHHIQLLHRELNVSIITILSWYANIDTTLYEEIGLEPKSLYEELFQNPAVIKLNPGDKDYFRLDSSRTELQEANLLNIIDEAVLASIMAALGTNESDIDHMINDADNEDNKILNLKNLSKLYRKLSLSRELNLSIQEFLQIKDLTGINPFISENNPAPSSSHTSETLRFIEVVKKIKSSRFTVSELDYLLRNRQQKTTSTVGLSNESISLVLDEIRKGLQKIHVETTVLPDLDGELTKKKLALLSAKWENAKWDNALIEELISTIKGILTYETSLGDLPQGLDFPDELKSRISYDVTGKKLRFSGIMTSKQRQTFVNLMPGDGAYISAIMSLYDQPRTFISKKMRAFELEPYFTPLEPLPSTFEFPNDLKNKIYFNPTEKNLYFVGAMTDSERLLLELAGKSNLSDPARTQFIEAINFLFEKPNSIQLEATNIFLTEADGLILFDSNPPDSKPPFTIEERFNYILLKLMPHLRESLSKTLIKQKLAEVLNVKVKIMDELLTTWVNSPNRPWVGAPVMKSITEFLNRSFSESNPGVKLNETTFVDQFVTFRLLEKIATIVTKFNVGSKQLKWLFEEDYGPSVGWLNLNLLPVKEGAQPQPFNGWERLYDLFELRNGLRDGELVLSNFFVLARAEGTTKDSLLGKLSEDTGWSIDDLNFLAAIEGFDTSFLDTDVTTPSTYKDERALKQLKACFGISKRLGVSAEQCIAFANPEPTTLPQAVEISRSIKQAAKAKYENEQWLAVARPLRDSLREKQRFSLVSYLIAHPDPAKKQNWTDVNDLYSHFLIDVEMSPCHLTSRIKQANSSIQLFVQRCLMNLENEEISADNEIDDRWKEWKWMKTYRVWEANRKVFLWPENWIEPQLRDEKSIFFKEFENELMQNDITTETAEVAFQHYLSKLDEVARLEICGIYHQLTKTRPKISLSDIVTEVKEEEPRTLVDILHVFGRTRGIPHKYFYRQRINSARWTPWDKVDLDIEGDHLIPVIRNRRLYLFWPIFTEQAREPNDISQQPPPRPDKYWKIQMAWSEYEDKKWSAKKISAQALEYPPVTTLESHPPLVRRRNLAFRVLDKDEGLVVGVYEHGLFDDNYSASSKIAEFVFMGCDWMLKVIDNPEQFEAEIDSILGLANIFRFMTIRPNSNSANSDRLSVLVFTSDPTVQTDLPEIFKSMLTEPPILYSNPGGSRFDLLPLHQKHQFDAGRQIFFFQDDKRVFLVSPEDFPVNDLIDSDTANLSIDASVESRYYQLKGLSF